MNFNSIFFDSNTIVEWSEIQGQCQNSPSDVRCVLDKIKLLSDTRKLEKFHFNESLAIKKWKTSQNTEKMTNYWLMYDHFDLSYYHLPFAELFI